MTDIRASITKDLIDTLGEEAQKQAYEYVMTNSNQQATFCQKVKELTGKYDDKVVQSVLKRLVDYAFHARSNVEWQKYKKENTDRTASKEKKMGQREILKGGKKKGEP
jgi:UDP-glucose 6-dehydrogenase